MLYIKKVIKILKQIILFFCIIGIIGSIVLYINGVYGPFYNTTPLKAPFSFADSSPQVFKFKPEKSEDYMIEIHLSNKYSDGKIESILGKYFESGKGAPIDVGWNVKRKDKVIASGSNKEYGYSHIFGRDYTGIVIGRFFAKKNKKYELSLLVNSVNPEWDICMPHVEVGLHPAKWEYLSVFPIISKYIFIFSMVVLFIIVLVELIEKIIYKILKNRET
ncbi:MAG: hypothetical protein JW983_07375 [Elusimicrobia bacterium]|nr:hypothetical protein [Elusimicrobiota bacterium]